MPRRIDIENKADRVTRFGEAVEFTIEGESVARTINGFTATITYIVTDIIAPVESILLLGMLNSSIPRYGDTHPAIPDIFVTNIRSEAISGSPSMARVTVDYGFPALLGAAGDFDNDPDDEAPATLEISSTVQSATTNKDIDGNLIVIQFEKPDPETQTTTLVQQTGTVQFMAPMDVLRYRRRERNSPSANAILFKGHINSEPILDDPKHFWLCTRLDGVTDDGGLTYNVSYEFQRNPDSWNATVAFVEDGEIPPTVTVENGGILEGIKIYPEADFFDLELFLNPTP